MEVVVLPNKVGLGGVDMSKTSVVGAKRKKKKRSGQRAQLKRKVTCGWLFTCACVHGACGACVCAIDVRLRGPARGGAGRGGACFLSCPGAAVLAPGGMQVWNLLDQYAVWAVMQDACMGSLCVCVRACACVCACACAWCLCMSACACVRCVCAGG